MELLKIGSNDWTPLIESGGYGWKRNDLDGDNTTRTKSGRLRRDKVAEKLTLSYKVRFTSRENLSKLNNDLRQETFYATVLDLSGPVTKEFYCSSFSTTLDGIYSGTEFWQGAEFTIIEV